MSVINKMLQDLEARESKAASLSADYQAPAKKTHYYVFAALVLVIAGLIYLWFWQISKDNQSQLMAAQTLTEETDAPLKVVKPMKVASKTQETVDTKPSTISLAPQSESPEEQVNNAEQSDSALNQPVMITNAEPSVDEINTIEVLSTEITPPNPTADNSEVKASVKQNEPQQQETNNDTLVAQSSNNSEQAFQKPEPTDSMSFSMSGGESQSETEQYKQQVAEYLSVGDKQLAISVLNNWLKLEPEHHLVRKKLASLYFAEGQVLQAQQVLEQAIQVYSKRTDYRMMLARMLVLQDKKTEALQWLSEIRESNDTEFLAYRAALAQQLKSRLVAKQDYQKLVTLSPEQAKWWMGLAIIEDQLGNSTTALQAYRRANDGSQLSEDVLAFIQQRIKILAEFE